MGEHRHHHPAHRAARHRLSGRRRRAPRLGQPEEAEGDVGNAEPRRDEPGGRRAQRRGERADRRADHHPRRGRRGEPAERLGALLRRHRVADVGLDHPGGPGPRPLDQARDEEHREERARRQQRRGALGAGRREEQVGEGRDHEPAEDGRTAADAVGEPAPERRGRQLRHRERRDHQPDDDGVGAEAGGVERQQRQHDEEAQHVHETGGHEEREAPERRAVAHPGSPCSRPKSRNATAEAAASNTP